MSNNLIILYGSSCIGKSQIMHSMDKLILKLEMDDCKYWLFPENKRVEICIKYLLDYIEKNKQKNIVVTCGHLPLPNHNIYKTIEGKFNLKIIHTLILLKSIDKYMINISKRNRQELTEKLIQDYEWRLSKKHLYDNIIYNEY